MTDGFSPPSLPFIPPLPLFSTTTGMMMDDEYGVRRVKPLPKRRRMSPSADAETEADARSATTTTNTNTNTTTASTTNTSPTPNETFMVPLPSYYYPVFSSAYPHPHPHSTYHRSVLGGGEDEDDHLDGDYVDHLQTHGNLKRRKVPKAHALSSSPSPEGVHSSSSYLANANGVTGRLTRGREEVEEEEEEEERGDGELPPLSTLSLSDGSPPSHSQHSTYLPPLPNAKNKLHASVVTLAGLRHKEILKSRKRQLSAILGGLVHSDSLALDQALASSRLAWYRPVSLSDMTRAHRQYRHRRISSDTTSPLSSPPHISETLFTFSCPSTTTDRLLATREEVSMLQERFGAELARQAAVAAEAVRNAAAVNADVMAKTSRKTPGGGGGGGGGGNQQHQQRKRAPQMRPSETTAATTPSPLGENYSPLMPVKGGGGGKSKKKKKKRSALANASNPHHLRNYVPSRLPSSGPPASVIAQVVQNFLGPFPTRFLSADVKTSGHSQAQMGVPDEWMCAFCEYDLFYGSEARFRVGVSARKKVLRRRRRARERAARTAAGGGGARAAGPALSSQTEEMETEEDDGESEPVFDELSMRRDSAALAAGGLGMHGRGGEG